MKRLLEIVGGFIALLILLCVPAQAQERVAVEAPRQVFVVNTQDASVSLVDIATMKELQRIPVGPRPYGVVVSRDGRRLAVGVEDEEKVKFFDTTDFKLLGEARVGKMFNDHIVLTPDGRHVLVANFYSDDVVAIDAETMNEAYRIKGASAPHVIKYGPLRKHAYVTCKKITGIAIVDPQDRKLVKFHQINVNPRSLTFAPDESKIYFGSFWVDGFFEMDTASGKVTRLFALSPPSGNAGPQEVTYHGVETIFPGIVLAANEGRSYVDAVDVRSGKQLDRLTEGVANPCCVERIPSPTGSPVRALVSNIGDGTLQLIEVSPKGKLRPIAKATVGKRRSAWPLCPSLGSASKEETMRNRRKILTESLLTLLAASLPLTTAAQDGKRSWNFDAEKTGAIAAGFTNEVGEWKIVADESAPSKANVMAQLTKNERPVFNVALANETSYANVDITVKLKSIAGQIDQGGGVVWRARDPKNYYIARYNPLEDNYRVYKVAEGQRTQLGTAEVKRSEGWHSLRVTMSGQRIECITMAKSIWMSVTRLLKMREKSVSGRKLTRKRISTI